MVLEHNMKKIIKNKDNLIADMMNEVFDYVEKSVDSLTIEQLWEFDLFFYNIEGHSKGLKNEIRIFRRKKEKKLAKGK
jgi:hypothetical protein